MDDKKLKEGVSVKEIEAFARKNRFEVFLCLGFFLACIFSFIIWGTGWAIIGASIGAILGVLLPQKTGAVTKKVFDFVSKQEGTTQVVLAVVSLVLAIVIPPLYFLALGIHGGKAIYQLATSINS